MKTYLISDTHLNHGNIATYCDRPDNFTQLIAQAWKRTVKPDDVVIHLGDFAIGNSEGLRGAVEILRGLPGRKILIRGNHDRKHPNTWWMNNGFDFACDSITFRSCLLTHEPSGFLPRHCNLNIHGHLHNIWHGFHRNASLNANEEEQMKKHKRLRYPWQRLFAVEYTNYGPVEFEKFVSHPDKYFARGISNAET